MTSGPAAGRRDNGLSAPAYVPLSAVEPRLAEHILDALRRARIAAYVVPAEPPDDRDQLFVAADERSDARSVVASAARSFAQTSGDDGLSSDHAFDDLVADWHVDTVAAVRSAERDLRREDAEWRARLRPTPSSDEEHYVPPPAPPLPRLTGATVRALLVLVAALAVLAFGGMLGLGPDLRFLLGVAGLLTGAGLLVMRLRDRPPGDEDDDGAML